ncbi:MAG: transposase zinc-binding domain-containing protein [Acidobacteria bacterium]|nr:transposase zinc-binding domain-containing protein [Acidobacteriota bacterium]
MVVDRRISLESFKQIFRDWYEEFLRQYPEYERTGEVVQKMVGCGDEEQGYSEFICPRCGEEMILWKVWTPTHGVVYYLPDDAPDWVEEKASSNGGKFSLGFAKPRIYNAKFIRTGSVTLRRILWH